jgi:acetyltransferase
VVTLVLDSGEAIGFRPVRPDDEPLVAEAFRTASPETLLHRFFTPLREVPPSELRRLLTIDPARETCIVGELMALPGRRIVCGARFVRLTDLSVAEIALTVHDDFQRRGLGTFMLRYLIQLGRADGIRTFVANVLATNASMLRLLQKIAPLRRSSYSDGVCQIEFDLADAAPAVENVAGNKQ